MNDEKLEELLTALLKLIEKATEYLEVEADVNRKKLKDWSDEDQWNLGSFCFHEDEDFGFWFGGVEYNAGDDDSFDNEFQDEWE